MYVKEMSHVVLDVAEVRLRSRRRDRVVLPYSGDLAPLCRSPESAEIAINVQPFSRRSAVLSVLDENGRHTRYTVSMSSDEVDEILSRFFDLYGCGRSADSGLSDYWLGVWQANYIAWRRIAKNAYDALTAVENMDQPTRMTFLSELRKTI